MENIVGELRRNKKTADHRNGEETKTLRCGNCNAENYFPRIGKRCKMRRRSFKTFIFNG